TFISWFFLLFFFFSSRRRHTRFSRDWSSDVCSSDLVPVAYPAGGYRYDIPFGVIERPALPLDVPANGWAEAARPEGDGPTVVLKIGRASCRETVKSWVVHVSKKDDGNKHNPPCIV